MARFISLNLRLLPCLAERRKVLPGIPVEIELVRYDLKDVLGAILVCGETVFRQRVRQVTGAEDRVVDVGPQVLSTRQRHLNLLLRRLPQSGQAAQTPRAAALQFADIPASPRLQSSSIVGGVQVSEG
jgi:hypothetical protein